MLRDGVRDVTPAGTAVGGGVSAATKNREQACRTGNAGIQGNQGVGAGGGGERRN